MSKETYDTSKETHAAGKETHVAGGGLRKSRVTGSDIKRDLSHMKKTNHTSKKAYHMSKQT